MIDFSLTKTYAFFLRDDYDFNRSIFETNISRCLWNNTNKQSLSLKNQNKFINPLTATVLYVQS